LSYYLKKLLEDEKLRKTMGEKSLEIIEKYNYKKVVEYILSAIKFLLTY